jgi:hypothetical protein
LRTAFTSATRTSRSGAITSIALRIFQEIGDETFQKAPNETDDQHHLPGQSARLEIGVSDLEARNDTGGVLFLELPRGKTGKPTAYASRFLAEWIRKDLDITDENIEPNHSMRHYVKSQLLKAKVDVKIRDMICGHGKNIARKYEHADIVQMSEAISLLPNPLASAQYCSITTS